MLTRLLLTVFALAASALSCQAQVLRWTYPLPDPSFSYEYRNISHHRTDSVGNAAFIVTYGDEGSQLLWLSSKGRLIHSVELPKSGDFSMAPSVLRVSSSSVILRTVDVNGKTHLLRRYQLKGRKVVSSDLPIGPSEVIPHDALGDMYYRTRGHDPSGFFIFRYTPDFNQLVEIRRYGN